MVIRVSTDDHNHHQMPRSTQQGVVGGLSAHIPTPTLMMVCRLIKDFDDMNKQKRKQKYEVVYSDKKRKFEVTCSKCKQVRLVSGHHIREWLRGHSMQTLEDFNRENLCPRCCLGCCHKGIINCEQEYRVVCSQCGVAHIVNGRDIYGWMHRHSIKVNEVDGLAVARYYDENMCSCCCHKRESKWRDHYVVQCPKCKQTRTVGRYHVQIWNAKYGKLPKRDISDTDRIAGAFQMQVFCLTCSARRKPIVGRADSGGYILVAVLPENPYFMMARSHNKKWCYHGYILEHRYVMAQLLGRPLLPSEQVHHRDGNKQNNKPENLELRKLHHGNGASITPTAEELLKRVEQLLEENTRLKESNKSRELVNV